MHSRSTVVAGTGAVFLGYTLPELLDQACDRYPNAQALNQWTEKSWQSLSNQMFRATARKLALGLLSLELETHDRIAMLMHSDVSFCIADMGSLIAGLVNIPIDLTQTLENIVFILNQTAAKALIVSDLDLLYQVVPHLWNTPNLKIVIVAEVPADWQRQRSQLMMIQDKREAAALPAVSAKSQCLYVPLFLCHAQAQRSCPSVPHCIQMFSLAEIQAQGQSQTRQLRPKISPSDLATIIYTAGPTGHPRGVMLTHENLAANTLGAFSTFPELRVGVPEVALSVLPLTHVFARIFLYGHLYYSHRLYFTTPGRVTKHLQEIKPTIFATVPRFLEKIHQMIWEKGNQSRGMAKLIFQWSWNLARHYQLGHPQGWFYQLQQRLADALVFSKWRSALGGAPHYLICGGAALRADLLNFFAAVRMPVLQGYGLTETSSVVCVNRIHSNHAGTVGYPIAGVEIAIAEDHEILIKAPYVMAGYYRDPDATRAVLDADGWLHTGDLGEFTADGALKITGCKKDLFKLSTGKYVTPLPLEEQLKQSTLVQQAVVVGAQRKFCAMLIFPNVHKLQSFAKSWGVDLALEDLLRYPKVLEHYQTLIDTANRSLPPWSTVKRFQLINQDLNVENGLLTPTLKLNRSRLNEVFATEIAALYTDAEGAVKSGMKVISPQRHPEREGDVMTDGATLVSYPDISVST